MMSGPFEIAEEQWARAAFALNEAHFSSRALRSGRTALAEQERFANRAADESARATAQLIEARERLVATTNLLNDLAAIHEERVHAAREAVAALGLPKRAATRDNVVPIRPATRRSA